MSGVPMAQRCPHCGEQPMSRLRFLFLTGTRARCRRCGKRIRLDLSRVQLLMIVGLGALLGGAIVLLADSATEFAIGGGLALLIALIPDQWAWRRLPWLSDEREAEAAAAMTGAPAGALDGQASRAATPPL